MSSVDLTREAFNSKQVCALTGITFRQLDYWDRQGLAKPSLSPASGRGSRRLYAYADLLALQAVKRLRDFGISLQKVRKCVRYLRKHLPGIGRPLTYCVLLTDGDAVYLVKNPREMVDTTKQQGQYAWVQIMIDEIDHAMRARVEELVTPRVETVTVGEYAYQVQVEPDKEGGGYVAEVAGLPGCITQGDTVDEILLNAEEAIELWLEAHDELEAEGIKVRMRRQRRGKASA